MFAWFCILLFKICGVLTLGWGWLVVLFLIDLVVSAVLHAAFNN